MLSDYEEAGLVRARFETYLAARWRRREAPRLKRNPDAGPAVAADPGVVLKQELTRRQMDARRFLESSPGCCAERIRPPDHLCRKAFASPGA